MAGLVPLIGVDKFHYAIITSDLVADTLYETSVAVPNVNQANIAFNGTSGTFFADNGPAVVSSQIGEVEVEIIVGDLPPEDYAKLVGAKRVNGKISYNKNDIAPDCAVAFRFLKSDGSYRYMWLLKGKFTHPDQNAESKSDSVNFQPQTLNFKGVARLSDGNVYFRVDDNDADLPEPAQAVIATEFFTDPDYVPQTT